MRIAVAILLSALSCAANEPSPVEAEALPTAAARTPEHVWLQQFVGDWVVTAEATMEPGAPPTAMEGTEHVRSVGGLWILAEGVARVDGTELSSVLTVGYDAAVGAFVGTWLDSMQTKLWTYRGSLDTATNTLTLESEGPALDDPSKNVLFRDAYTLVSPDHKILKSSARNADGSWTTFMTANYHRKR